MARKLKPHEERVFLEATSVNGSALNDETCPACQIRRAMGQQHADNFDRHNSGLGNLELLLGEELGPDDEWF